jgi:hypothetical protein
MLCNNVNIFILENYDTNNGFRHGVWKFLAIVSYEVLKKSVLKENLPNITSSVSAFRLAPILKLPNHISNTELIYSVTGHNNIHFKPMVRILRNFKTLSNSYNFATMDLQTMHNLHW